MHVCVCVHACMRVCVCVCVYVYVCMRLCVRLCSVCFSFCGRLWFFWASAYVEQIEIAKHIAVARII